MKLKLFFPGKSNIHHCQTNVRLFLCTPVLFLLPLPQKSSRGKEEMKKIIIITFLLVLAGAIINIMRTGDNSGDGAHKDISRHGIWIYCAVSRLLPSGRGGHLPQPLLVVCAFRLPQGGKRGVGDLCLDGYQ